MEKENAKLQELLDLAELRMTIPITEQAVFETVKESVWYKPKRNCDIWELATAISSADREKWGWIIVCDNEERLEKGLMHNKAAFYRHGNLEQYEYVRTFYYGHRVVKARCERRGDRADWYVLSEPDTAKDDEQDHEPRQPEEEKGN